MIQPLWVFSDWGLLVLRVVLGLVLIVHGYPKLRGLKQTAGNFSQMGFKPGIFWATIVMLLEVVGGIFLILGFLTQVVSFFLVIEFIVILIKVKRKAPLVGGFELDLLILAAAAALLTLGAGRFGLDTVLGLILY
ncbi:DoxX family protein [Patescibacteria group bacterium]|nr:DoxX family protein [Patescibacteria group bacterium]